MLHRFLAGDDGPERPALPVGELLHPVALAFVALLVVNDWILKGSGWLPGWLTGKLSDVAGLAFFPLVLTVLFDLLLLAAARLGRPTDFSLSAGKLTAATVITAVLFTTVKLSPAAAELVGGWLTAILPARAAILPDPTDLLALPGLLASLWVGRAELARVPLGRLEVLIAQRRQNGADTALTLADVVRAGGDGASVDALTAQLESYADGRDAAASRIRDHLATLRGRT